MGLMSCNSVTRQMPCRAVDLNMSCCAVARKMPCRVVNLVLRMILVVDAMLPVVQIQMMKRSVHSCQFLFPLPLQPYLSGDDRLGLEFLRR